MKYAQYDENGHITALWDSEVRDEGFEPAIELTDEQWVDPFRFKVDLSGAVPVLVLTEPYVPTLDDLKADAMAQAHIEALEIRRQIANRSTTERAIAWVLKAQYSAAWAMMETAAALPADDPTRAVMTLFAPFAQAAQQGYAIEAGQTGEDAADLRDRAIAKANGFFLACQLVEGMERLVETRIGAVQTEEELATVVAELRDLQAQAMAQLEALRNA